MTKAQELAYVNAHHEGYVQGYKRARSEIRKAIAPALRELQAEFTRGRRWQDDLWRAFVEQRLAVIAAATRAPRRSPKKKGTP